MIRWRLTTVVLIGLVALTSCNSDSKSRQEEQKKDAEGVKKGFEGSNKTLRNFEFPDTPTKGQKGRTQPPPDTKKKGSTQ
ncbi:MAG: hypothetical protein JWQ87_4642 [Candidatus Sulfotelmatobacter sp.]|nr:hypothetical protein [Candidatus Sulfotelmatobacter sp.]